MRPGSRTLGAFFIVPGLAAILVLAGCGKMDRLTTPASTAESAATVVTRPAPSGAELEAAIHSQDDDLLPELSGRSGSITGPTVITQPGFYRVTRDFSVDASTGDGIVVRASGVLLWLGRHSITGPAAKLGRGIVIEGARHVLVQGGRLERFGIGVALDGARDCAVRDLDIAGANEFANPGAGIPPQIGILLLNSAECRIAHNRIEGVNLGIFVRGGGSYRNGIRRNRVVGGSNGLLGVCYNPAPGAGPAGPTHDEVDHNTLSRFGKGIQTSSGSTENRFVENVIEYFVAAWTDFSGTNVFLHNQTTAVTP